MKVTLINANGYTIQINRVTIGSKIKIIGKNYKYQGFINKNPFKITMPLPKYTRLKITIYGANRYIFKKRIYLKDIEIINTATFRPILTL